MSMDDKYPLALPEGTILAGQYMIEKVLGQGGFGITYRATDHKTNQKVAVKEFFPDTLAYRERTTVISYPGERSENYEYGKESFLQEAKTLAEFIGNENIVRIHSYFEENGTAYFVMDYIEGKSFDEYIKERGGKVSVEEAKNILVPVMDALGVVHSRGIVHRDVTPDNIYITNEGTVKLLDFGAARYSLGDKSRSLDVILKHGFAPKEQYTRRGKQGPFTDIYSLAATFYFAITGKRPPDSVERLDVDDLVPPSNLGVKITDYQEKAILQALSVQPVERFQSMAEFKKILLNETTVTNQIFFNAPEVAAPAAEPTSPVVQQGSTLTQQGSSAVQQSISAASQGTPFTQQEIYAQAVPKVGTSKNKKLIIGLSAACGVFVLVVAFLVGNVFSNKNDVTTSGGGSVNQENSSQSSGSYADNSTTATPESATATPEPATPTPEPATPEPVTYDVSELIVVGNTPANIKNGGMSTVYDDNGGAFFFVTADKHSLRFNDGESTTNIYKDYKGGFSCLSYYDGILYFLYNGHAYMKYNVTDVTDQIEIPELETYGGSIQRLYVTTGCYFIYADGKLYRVSRKTGETEEWISVSSHSDIAFGDDGWIYYIGYDSEGLSTIYKVAADDFNNSVPGIFLNSGYFTDPVVCGDYIYILVHMGAYTSVVKINVDLSLPLVEEWDISDFVNESGQDDGNFACELNVIGGHQFFSVYDSSSGLFYECHGKENSSGDGSYKSSGHGKQGASDGNFICVVDYGGKYNSRFYAFNDDGNLTVWGASYDK